MRERTLVEDHSARLASQRAFAKAYHAGGQVREAIKLLEHVVAVKAKYLSPSHPSRVKSENCWLVHG